MGSSAEKWSERETSAPWRRGEARPLAVHVGGGIATRDAYHKQRAAHREALERGTAGAPERLALPVVTVPAASIVVAEGGPNYRPVVKSEGKQEKQALRGCGAGAQEGDGDGGGGRRGGAAAGGSAAGGGLGVGITRHKESRCL